MPGCTRVFVRKLNKHGRRSGYVRRVSAILALQYVLRYDGTKKVARVRFANRSKTAARTVWRCKRKFKKREKKYITHNDVHDVATCAAADERNGKDGGKTPRKPQTKRPERARYAPLCRRETRGHVKSIVLRCAACVNSRLPPLKFFTRK